MGMAAILFSGTEPSEQIVNIISTEGPIRNLVKTVQTVSEKMTFKIYTILYMCRAQGQEQITPKFLTVIKILTSLILHKKLQPLVFITHWENDFSRFSPYKCMWA